MKKSLLISLIILGMVLVLGVGGFILVKTGVLNAFTGSSTYLSISNVQYDGSGQVLIYGVAGTGANNLIINVPQDKLNSYLSSSGVKATKDVTGSITLVNPTRSFPATINTGDVFQSLNYQIISFFKACPSNYGGGNLVSKYDSPNLIINGQTLCVYASNLGNDAHFNNQVLDSATINAQIGGASGSLSVNPINPQKTIFLNDGLTKISWTGNLLSDNSVNAPSNEVLFSQSQFSKLISPNAWSNYGYAKSSYQSCISSATQFTNDFGKIEDCITNFNYNLNGNILKDQTFNYVNSVGGQSGAFQTKDSNTVYFNLLLNNPSVLPTFVITLPATSVGIQPLSGVPSITQCINNLNIGSGDSQTVNAQVKNSGNQAGEFTGQITCNGNVQGVSNSQLVSAGQTVTMPITISGINTNQGTSQNSCTLKVTDTNSQKSTSCSFTVGVTYRSSVVCTPNEKFCLNADTIATCNALGTDFTTQKCDVGQKCIVSPSGFAECSTSKDNLLQCSSSQHVAPELKIFGLTFLSERCVLNTGWIVLIVIGILIGIALLIWGIKTGIKRLL